MSLAACILHAIRLILFDVSNTLTFMSNPDVILPSHARRLAKSPLTLRIAIAGLVIAALVNFSITPPGLTAVDAERATYPSPWTDSGSLTLEDGLFVQQPYRYGPSSRLKVDLWGFARGDIDNKSGGDVATILVTQPFGDRELYELHLLAN